MDFRQGPPANDRPSDDSEGRDVITIVPKGTVTSGDSRSGELTHDQDAGRDAAKMTNVSSISRGRFDFSARPEQSSIHVSPPLSGIGNEPSRQPSIGKRIFRSSTRFLIAVLIGVGATLAWQSRGEEAKEAVRTWAPSLAGLLPASKTKSAEGAGMTAGQQMAAAPSVQQAAREPVSSRQAPVITPGPTAGEVGISSALARRLKPVAGDIAAVRRNVGQLAAKQEQMAQNIATLLALDRSIEDKLAQYRTEPVPLPPPKPAHAPHHAIRSHGVPPALLPPR